MGAVKDINNVNLVGRLTRDQELRYTRGGYPIGKLGLAVNRLKKTGETWEQEVNFFEVSVMGKIAEALDPYLTKGSRIAVSGELKQERWEKDGRNHSKVVIQAQDIQLLGSPKQAAQGPAASPPAPNPPPQETRPRDWHEFTGVPKSPPEENLFNGPEDFDDDIPF